MNVKGLYPLTPGQWTTHPIRDNFSILGFDLSGDLIMMETVESTGYSRRERRILTYFDKCPITLPDNFYMELIQLGTIKIGGSYLSAPKNCGIYINAF